MHLEERMRIADQLAKYAQLWDRKAAKEFAELFTEDGIMDRHVAGALDEASVVRGRAEILSYAKASYDRRLKDRQSRHHFSGLVFEELSEDTALTEHTFLVTHKMAGKAPFIVASGTYRLRWRKTGDRWLMSHRTLFADS
ncbi:MAG: nuclear transport factor 2 family protein [Rhodobiaceae bacterium]|nr:nuclear transport factor 2 family protein [Rhodobiaceae bacterium]